MSRAKRGRKSTKKGPVGVPVPVLRPNVAGIDLGSTEHWVCGPARADGEPNVEVFGTTTGELERMVRWLVEQDVESVAMESTHVYWVPVYELLESNGIDVQLVNAQQLHNVPGRKTDMLDCQWLQRLHSCGLLRGSFRPDDAICRLRALQRQIANLVEERTRTVQWMQKALDQMNVQVHRAVSDITGTTGMSIVRAIVDGERDPIVLAGFRDHRCKKSAEVIADHLRGNWRDEHLFTLASALRLYDMLEGEIARFNDKLREDMAALVPSERQTEPVPPHPNPTKERAIKRRGEQELRTELWRFAGVDLTRINGISADTAMVIITEVGLDLSSFPSENHFVSWLRLCPRRPISGGKQLHKRPNGTAANRVSGALRMCALSLTRSSSALGAYYRRLASRKEGKVALFAVARKLAQWVYRMLRYGQDYVDEGQDAYEARFQRARLAGVQKAARQMGYMLVPQTGAG
jgi:transposase